MFYISFHIFHILRKGNQKCFRDILKRFDLPLQNSRSLPFTHEFQNSRSKKISFRTLVPFFFTFSRFLCHVHIFPSPSPSPFSSFSSSLLTFITHYLLSPPFLSFSFFLPLLPPHLLILIPSFDALILRKYKPWKIPGSLKI